MRKRRLGKTGLMVSPVVFGGVIGMNETPETAREYVASAVAAGINYFDIAPSYGNAEERVGPALAPYRKDIYLACKTLEREAEGARRDLLNSLKLMHTDYFDVYQLHGISTQEDVDRAFASGGVMETMEWARREGLIRYVGFSTHSEEAALEICRYYDFDTVLFPMNWVMGAAYGFGDRMAELMRREDIGFLAMKMLALRKWYPEEERQFPKSWCKLANPERPDLAILGMKYALSKGAATLVPPGDYENYKFVLDNIEECLDNPLTATELEQLRIEAREYSDNPIFAL